MIVEFENGKYAIEVSDNGNVRLLRHGEPWATAPMYSKMLIAIAYEVEALRKQQESGETWQAALQSQVSNTDGWVMVPVEPTQAMCNAAKIEARDWQNSGNIWHAMMWLRIYKRMIAAAPKAPQQVSNTPQDGSLIESVPAARSEACGKFNAMVDEYIEDYEYDDGEACHSPSELERTLIADAIHGLLGLQEFIPLFLAWQSQCPAWHQFAAPPQQQEAVAWNKRKYAENLIRDICEEDEPKEGAYAVMVDLDWLKEFIIDTIPDLYVAPPTSTAIAARVIKQAAEALEPFALISSEGVIQQESGHVTVTTCAEYFHRARQCLETLAPAIAEAELEALMMKAGAAISKECFARSVKSEPFPNTDECHAIVRRVLEEKGDKHVDIY